MEDIQQDLISRFDTGGGEETSQSRETEQAEETESTQPEHSPQPAGGDEGEDRPPQGSQETAEDQGSEGDELPPHLEKRLKDTYSNYTKERQARLELEKTVAQLQGQMAAMQQSQPSEPTSKPVTDSDAFKEFRDNFDDNPEAAIEKLIQSRTTELQQQINEVGSREQKKEAARLDQQEAECRKKYKDYDEVMTPFVELLKTDPTTHEAWVSNGRSAEAAYQLAKRKADYDKYLATGVMPEPEKSEETGEPAKPPNRRGRTLSNVQSQSPAPVAKTGPAAGIPTHQSQFAEHLFGNR